MKKAIFLLPIILFVAACSSPSSTSNTTQTKGSVEDSTIDDNLLKNDRYAMFESKNGDVFLFDKVKGAVWQKHTTPNGEGWFAPCPFNLIDKSVGGTSSAYTHQRVIGNRIKSPGELTESEKFMKDLFADKKNKK